MNPLIGCLSQDRLTMSKAADQFWSLLKKRMCVHPDTAARIVLIGERDFKDAFKEFTESHVVVEKELDKPARTLIPFAP